MTIRLAGRRIRVRRLGGFDLFKYVPDIKRWVKSETLDMGNNNVVYNDNTWELVSHKLR